MKAMILLCFASLFMIRVHAQDSAKLVPRPKSKGEYIILKDSTKLIGNVRKTRDGIKLDDKLYRADQLLGYKEGGDYHAIFDGGVYWVWALGKIQAYSQWQTTGTGTDYNPHSATPAGKWTTVDRHSSSCYLKKGDGQLVEYTSASLLDLIRGNEEAEKEFHKRYKKITNNKPLDPFYGSLRKVLSIYNGGDFIEY